MRDAHRAAGRRFAVVWLPTLDEHRPGELDRLRTGFLARVGAAGVEVIDLVGDLRRLSPAGADSLFLVEPGAGGRHYSEAGHAFVAERLRERLDGPGRAN